MVTATRPMGKPEAVTIRQDWERWVLHPQNYRKCLPLAVEEVEGAQSAQCPVCGTVGLKVHAYKRANPWGYIVLWECGTCLHCIEI